MTGIKFFLLGGALVVGLVVGACDVALAHELHPGLTLSSPEDIRDCPTATELASSVSRVLGHEAVDVGSKSPRAIDVTLRRLEQRGFEVEIRLVGGWTGARRLAYPSARCGELTESIAVVIALMLDNERAEHPMPAKAPAAAEGASPSRPWHLDAHASGALAQGVTQRWSPGFVGGLRIEPAPFARVGLAALWLPSRSITYAGGGVGVSLEALLAELCAPVFGRDDAARVALCAVPGVGRLGGHGRGFAVGNRDAYRPWYALGASIEAQGPIVGRLGWMLGAVALAPLVREEFSIDRAGVAYTPSLAGGALHGGVSVSIF